MEKLIEIYRELYDAGVVLVDRALSFSNGAKSTVLRLSEVRTYGVFIDSTGLTPQEEVALIAHEAGHVATGSTHEVGSPYDVVDKHENRANKWAIKKLIPKDELDGALSKGYTDAWELAEYFCVPEPFMNKAIEFYQQTPIGFENT